MRIFSIAAALAVMLTNSLSACADFLLLAEDKTPVCGRSLEFALDLQSTFRTEPRGQKKQSTAPGGKQGYAWTSKYGYVGIIALGLDFFFDGLNEKGLSLGALWLPGTEYAQVAPSDADKAVYIQDAGSWILGNFATVNEVKDGLGKIKIWAEGMPQLAGGVPTLHFAIHDIEGNSIVVEFIKGETKIHDNPVQVMTNAPQFDWHLTNLENFLNLKAMTVSAINVGGLVLGPTGQGSGMLGIPGDWTPPSRFVRLVNFKQYAQKPKNAAEAMNLAVHLLNTVDIPYGDVAEAGKTNNIDYTQWIVVKDLKNKILQYRTYKNQSFSQIDMSKLDLSEKGKRLKLEMSHSPSFENVTGNFKP